MTDQEIKAIKLARDEECFDGFERICRFALMKRMWLGNDIKSLDEYEIEYNTPEGLIRRCFSFDNNYIYMRVMYFANEDSQIMTDSKEAYRKLR